MNVELELVLAAAKGDEDAFERLLVAEIPPVYRAVLAVVRSPDDAQDVLQESAAVAWRELGRLRDPAKWAAWFRRIALRAAVDRARRTRRVAVVDVSRVDVVSADPSGAWTDRVAVMTALEMLPIEDRVILGLRYGADLDVADVAAALDIPIGTAKSRLHRAVARLAAAMGGDDGR